MIDAFILRSETHPSEFTHSMGFWTHTPSNTEASTSWPGVEMWVGHTSRKDRKRLTKAYRQWCKVAPLPDKPPESSAYKEIRKELNQYRIESLVRRGILTSNDD